MYESVNSQSQILEENLIIFDDIIISSYGQGLYISDSINSTKVVLYLGISCGFMASLFTFFLTYNFAIEIFKTDEIMACVLGILSVVPIAALGCLNCTKVFGAILKKITQFANNDNKNIINDILNIHFIKQLILIFWSVTSAITLTYISHNIFKKINIVLAFLIDIPTFITRLMLYSWAINNLYKIIIQNLKNIFNKDNQFFENNITQQRYYIKNQISIAIMKLSYLKSEDLINMVNLFAFEKNNTFNIGKIRVKFIVLLSNIDNINDNNKKSSKFIRDIFATIIGMSSSYAIVPIGIKIFSKCFLYFNYSKEISHKLGIFFSYISALCVGALLSYTTIDSLNKCYNYCYDLLYKSNYNIKYNDQKFKQNIITIIAIILSITTALPRIEIGRDNIKLGIWNYYFMICIAISSLFKDYWSITNFIKYFFIDKNEFLLTEILTKAITNLDKLENLHISNIHNFFYETKIRSVSSINESTIINLDFSFIQ